MKNRAYRGVNELSKKKLSVVTVFYGKKFNSEVNIRERNALKPLKQAFLVTIHYVNN